MLLHCDVMYRDAKIGCDGDNVCLMGIGIIVLLDLRLT